MNKKEHVEPILPVPHVDITSITERLVKIATGNDHRLSDMADNKAQILITVNSIILSAIISLILGHLKDTKYLVIPTFILLSTSLVTLVLAILATRPSLPSGKFTASDLRSKSVNLLFFGNFYQMKLADFSSGMTHTLSDEDFLYQSLIKDLYNQGKVLGRKYRLLRAAYNIFMFGLIIVIVAFVLLMRKNIFAD